MIYALIRLYPIPHSLKQGSLCPCPVYQEIARQGRGGTPEQLTPGSRYPGKVASR